MRHGDALMLASGEVVHYHDAKMPWHTPTPTSTHRFWEVDVVLGRLITNPPIKIAEMWGSTAWPVCPPNSTASGWLVIWSSQPAANPVVARPVQHVGMQRRFVKAGQCFRYIETPALVNAITAWKLSPKLHKYAWQAKTGLTHDDPHPHVDYVNEFGVVEKAWLTTAGPYIAANFRSTSGANANLDWVEGLNDLLVRLIPPWWADSGPDTGRFPHTCRCGAPAYFGATPAGCECSRAGCRGYAP